MRVKLTGVGPRLFINEQYCGGTIRQNVDTMMDRHKTKMEAGVRWLSRTRR